MDKDITDKPAIELIDPRFILGMGRVLTFGANKYNEGSWKDTSFKNDKDYGAAMRHLLKWRNGEEKDEESGESHLLHAACDIMILYYDELQKKEEICSY